MKEIHLICNAHIDPCWQWDIEEGVATVLSTFRCAADFCEEYPSLIFNHNEAMIYQWVELYDYKLFERIKKLVKEKKWHIMGGWYLQPDCNLPSGESFVRQILEGRLYFKEKFGVYPTTAMNVDSFGHTRGLVQILYKAGYDSYIFCRPFKKDLKLTCDNFIWQGYDESRILGFRMFGIYNSLYGMACKKIKTWIENFPETETGCIFWGVGNHGGGPSRVDLNEIEDFITKSNNRIIMHSTPEAYFQKIKKHEAELPVWDKGLNYWGRGCYTSMSRVKQKHRQLENEFYKTEKMSVYAEIAEGEPYLKRELDEALKALLFSEFHDILPGSAIRSVEETALTKMAYGMELLRRIAMKCFLKLCSGQSKAKGNTIPILVYNPHPYPVEEVFECEFMLANMNVSGTFKNPVVYCQNIKLDTQCEKEESNFPIDWRKRVVFKAAIPAAQMSRFDCVLEDVESELTKHSMDVKAVSDVFLNPDYCHKINFEGVNLPLRLPLGKPVCDYEISDGYLIISSPDSEVVFNMVTGTVQTIKINGHTILGNSGMKLKIFEDTVDSWGIGYSKFENLCGEFEQVLDEAETEIPKIQVVENGAVRIVIEVMKRYKNSQALVTYKILKKMRRIDVEIKVWWCETDRILKFIVPYNLNDAKYTVQTSYGNEELEKNGDEIYMQQWCGVFDEAYALAIINEGTYGGSCDAQNMSMSLLRSPAYASHPSPTEAFRSPSEYRHVERMDQGEHVFNFSIVYGETENVRNNIDRWAQYRNEKPMIVSVFPEGCGEKKDSVLTISEEAAVQMTCLKKAENRDGYIVRLFEPLGIEENITVKCPIFNIEQQIKMNPFEIKTFLLNVFKFEEISLMEEDGE